MGNPRVLVALATLAVAAAAPAASQELRPWNQEEVTGLATELATAVSQARRAARTDPSVATARDRRTRRFLDAIRRLETTTLQLATALQQGQGRTETESIALRVRRLVRDARQAGAGIPTSLQTQADIAPAEELLRRLAPFYFPAEDEGGAQPPAPD